MTISEKWFRSRYKLKPTDKLSKEQWKQVNDLHNALKVYNTPKLPHGTILVERRSLIEHLNNVKNCLKYTDKIMLNPKYKDFANGEGGKEMAKVWNALNLTFQSLSYFQLKIPLERLNATEMDDIY